MIEWRRWRVEAAGPTLLATLLVAGPAAAQDPFGDRPTPSLDPCARPRLAPAAASFDGSGLDAPRPGCAVDELGVVFGAAAVDGAATPTARLELRRAGAGGLELGVAARVLAPTRDDGAWSGDGALGPLVLGAARAIQASLLGARPALRAGLAFELPGTDRSRATPTLVALPSLDAQLAPRPWLALHARAALRLTAVDPAGAAASRGAALAGLGATVGGERLGLALGVELQGALRPADLDHLAGRAALRVGLGPLVLETGAALTADRLVVELAGRLAR